MESFDVFTDDDLRQRPDELLQGTEQGRLAFVTNQGHPAFLAVPFDERLLVHGLNRTLAICLVEYGVMTVTQAAQIAGLSLDELLDILQEAGIPAVDYPPEELEMEMEPRP